MIIKCEYFRYCVPYVNIAPWSALTEAAQQQEDGEEEGVGGGHDEDMQSPPSRHYPRLVQQASVGDSGRGWPVQCRLSSSSAPDNSVCHSSPGC